MSAVVVTASTEPGWVRPLVLVLLGVGLMVATAYFSMGVAVS